MILLLLIKNNNNFLSLAFLNEFFLKIPNYSDHLAKFCKKLIENLIYIYIYISREVECFKNIVILKYLFIS